MKFDLSPTRGDKWNRTLQSADIREWVAILEAIKEELGPDIPFGVDLHWTLNPQDAVNFLKEVEHLGLWFVEDPVPTHNADAIKAVTESTSVPIVTGENLFTRHTFRPFIEKQAVDAIQIDTQKAGGLMETKWISDWANLYNIPMFASPIDVPTVRRLAEECPRIIAIKDSSGDLPNMMRMIAAVQESRPDFSFLTGWDAALMPMLLIGCHGGTNAASGIVPELTRKLYDDIVAQRIDEARRLQFQLLPLFDAMLYSAEFPEGFRAALRLRGFEPGVGRQPKSAVQEFQLKEFARRLQCLLAEQGFADEPVGGCPAGQVDAEQVAEIAKNVVRELRRRGVAD